MGFDTLGRIRLYVIWFLLPSFSIYHISYLFMISLFFSEKCPCPFIHLDYLRFLQWVIWVLYGFWILALVSDIKLKVFSSFCTLSLHYFDCFLCCAESWVQLNPLCLFLLLLSVLLKSSLSNLYANQGYEPFPQYSSSSSLLTAEGRDYQKQWQMVKQGWSL